MADKKETVKTEAAPAAAKAEPAPAPVPAIPPLTLELDQETLEGLQLIADSKKTDVQTIVKKFCTRASKGRSRREGRGREAGRNPREDLGRDRRDERKEEGTTHPHQGNQDRSGSQAAEALG